MPDILLFDDEITDKYARENFLRVRRFIHDETFLKGEFKFMTASLTAATYPATVFMVHGLNFKPTDILQLAVTPDTVTTTWKYDSFTRDRIYVTISAACTVRAFVGRYEE